VHLPKPGPVGIVNHAGILVVVCNARRMVQCVLLACCLLCDALQSSDGRVQQQQGAVVRASGTDAAPLDAVALLQVCMYMYT
jgi:hypothetical protein